MPKAPLPDQSLVGTNLHALVIEHRHGTNVSLHTTHNAAWQALFEYVDEWWKDCGRPRPPEGTPSFDLIETYFEAIHDEHYTIVAACVES